MSANAPLQHDYDSALRFFKDYLELNGRGNDDHTYKDVIRTMVSRNERRIIFDISSLRAYSPEYAKNLLMKPIDYFPPLEHAVNLIAQEEQGLSATESMDLSNESKNHFRVGIVGSFGDLHTSPRFLNASFLSRMVVLDGIVTSCSLVRPKLLKSVHFEPKSKVFFARDYRDNTMIGPGNELPGSNAIPKEDADNNPLIMNYGSSVYRDTQTITIQEMPERSPPGQLPRAVDILLEDDLVDQVKPGDRISISGIYRAIGSAFNGVVPATFRAMVLANNIQFINQNGAGSDLSAVAIKAVDIKNFKKISKRRDLFDLMARSLAPSIYGHEFIKKAILLMLFGGVEKNLENGTHLRGDINILMVGDPSTAKSQLLRFVMNIAPLAVATTGRGSSGVGLTAAVVSDKETGERRLEAGAMVLADRGIVLIDEFDKMSDMDRVAIHEVMEQQTVTIAKAGIHATLNARCSVLAAANPVYGQYREYMSPQDNIRLPDSLISRFDLLFIVLDNMDPVRDRAIAAHVLRTHRYLHPGIEEGTPMDETFVQRLGEKANLNGEEEADETPVFQKYSQYLRHAAAMTDDDDDDDDDNVSEKEFLSVPFMKKYLHYARKRVQPALSEDASRVIAEAYAEFRQKRVNEEDESVREDKTFPVTPRTLETLIRLATAHAKIRMAHVVTKRDAAIARDLVEFCLYKKITAKPGKKSSKRRKVDKGDLAAASGSESELDEEEDENAMEHENEGAANDEFSILKAGSGLKKSLRKKKNEKDDDDEDEIMEGAEDETTQDTAFMGADSHENDENAIPTVDMSISPLVMDALLAVNGETDSTTIAIDDILAKIQAKDEGVSKHSLIMVLKKLEDENKVMVKEDEGVVYIV